MSGAVTPLPRALSLYLDCCRLGAAVLVVASHLRQYGALAPTAQHWLLNLGREAVIVFFVLSGFVIAYSTEHKNASLRDYCVARCTRIYSVAVPLLVLSFLSAAALVAAGSVPLSELYPIAQPWLYLPLHLLFMGELWTLSEVPPLLEPWWSLAYEVWYYVLFGARYYLRGRRRLLVGAALLLLMGPKLLLLLPVWASGVLLYHWQKRLLLTPPLARLGWCATLILLTLYKEVGLDVRLRALGTALWPFASLPLHSADRYLADYLVCLLVVINFLCAKQLALRLLLRVEQPLRRLAAYTFTLYLAHALVLRVWLALTPHTPGSLRDIAALVALIGLATWSLGQLSERRKGCLQAALLRLGAGRAAPARTSDRA